MVHGLAVLGVVIILTGALGMLLGMISCAIIAILQLAIVLRFAGSRIDLADLGRAPRALR